MHKRHLVHYLTLLLIFLAIQNPAYAQGTSTPPLILAFDNQAVDMRWQGDDLWVMGHEEARQSLSRWDGTTGVMEASPGFPPNTQFVWSHDGQHILAYHEMGLWLWDVTTNAILWGTEESTPLEFVEWSLDDRHFVTTSYDERLAYIRDVTTGAPILTLTPPAGLLGQATWSPDGTRIATLTGYNANWLNVWDAATGEKLVERDFSTPQAIVDIDAIEWNGDGTRLLAWGGSSIQLLDAATGATLLVRANIGSGFHPQWSPDHMRVLDVGASTTEFVMWDTATASIQFTLSPLPEDQRWDVALWSPDGAYLVVTGFGESSSVAVFDALTGERLGATPTNFSLTPVFEYSPDGRFVAVQGMSSPLTLFDAATGALLSSLPNSTAGASPMGSTPLAWSSDGSRIAALGGNGVVVWDTATGAIVADLPAQLSQPTTNPTSVLQLLFQPDGNRLAVRIGVTFCETLDCPSDVQIWAID